MTDQNPNPPIPEDPDDEIAQIPGTSPEYVNPWETVTKEIYNLLPQNSSPHPRIGNSYGEQLHPSLYDAAERFESKVLGGPVFTRQYPHQPLPMDLASPEMRRRFLEEIMDSVHDLQEKVGDGKFQDGAQTYHDEAQSLREEWERIAAQPPPPSPISTRSKTGMTESAARKLVKQIQVFAQKARSNILETMSGDQTPDESTKRILGDLNRNLFPEYSGRIGIIEMTMKMLQQETIEPGSLYNLLGLVDHEPGIGVVAVFSGVDIPSSHPVPKWIAGFDPEENDGN